MFMFMCLFGWLLDDIGGIDVGLLFFRMFFYFLSKLAQVQSLSCEEKNKNHNAVLLIKRCTLRVHIPGSLSLPNQLHSQFINHPSFGPGNILSNAKELHICVEN